MPLRHRLGRLGSVCPVSGACSGLHKEAPGAALVKSMQNALALAGLMSIGGLYWDRETTHPSPWHPHTPSPGRCGTISSPRSRHPRNPLAYLSSNIPSCLLTLYAPPCRCRAVEQMNRAHLARLYWMCASEETCLHLIGRSYARNASGKYHQKPILIKNQI